MIAAFQSVAIFTADLSSTKVFAHGMSMGAAPAEVQRQISFGISAPPSAAAIVVMSTQDDREIVATCLNRGATDYLVKPLRHNELRHIWTRVWWWQRNKVRGPLGSIKSIYCMSDVLASLQRLCMLRQGT